MHKRPENHKGEGGTEDLVPQHNVPHICNVYQGFKSVLRETSADSTYPQKDIGIAEENKMFRTRSNTDPCLF